MSIFARFIGAAAIATAALNVAPVFAEGGTLVIASSQVPRHLNGAVQSGIATAVPSTQIFASPMRYDENWEPQPYLAKSWEVSEDGLSVTLHLVDNATFHDGKPVTSEDVAFSIMTIKENHPFKSMFAPVEAIETPDPLTAVIKLSQPHPALLLAMSPALAPILPKHIYGDGQDIKSHPANSAPVGSGPFMLEEFTAGEAIVLKKNPNFFIEGRPKLDEIIIRIIKDPSALLIAMENGEADIYPFMAGAQEINRLSKVDGLEVTAEGYAAVGPINWLAFNTESPKLSDVRVRQAIGYAIDRDFITKALHRGVSTPQRGPIIESSPFFDPSIEAYDVDLDKANALMADAGFGDGMELTIDYIPGPKEQQQSVAEYMKSQLKKIGIDVTVRAAPDFPTWAGRVGGHDFELSMDVVFNWGDPVIGVHRTYLSDNIVKGVIWSNTQSYANPKVDDLLNAAAVELDMDKRKALYAEFQQIVAQDLPIYWINATPYHTAYSAKLSNPPKGIWGTMHPMDMVEITE
ncbi:ABC transporter substrate-binding protein [Sulfitobacter sp.]|uniref:ABC transporter substrate-binding protein n=1 Tax=Sulfitobacter sp. TaxID=1903071 RepID=UPI003F6C6A7D